MKVAFITRSTLYSVPGGDTVQVVQTARQLVEMGVDTDILLSNAEIRYDRYDLLHFFNLIRPADILYHSKKAKKPFVVSTILCNYSEYDKYHRKGIGALLGWLPGDSIEYLKTIARWILGRDHLSSLDYTWKGQRQSIIEILNGAAMILPNSESESRRVKQTYFNKIKYMVVPNGINPVLFKPDLEQKKDDLLVLCVARIEGIKNQINLIKALNNTKYKLLIIGAHAPNQIDYYNECKSIAADNVSFVGHIPQNELVAYYEQAKVHILPSWFETTGLSSVEAAVMGCNIVITDKGDTREYFGDEAFYCNPAEPESIFKAVEAASAAPFDEELRQRILKQYTWKHAAVQTLKAYHLAAIA
ncbi:glycosyltransferase family 4 protein [Mucilaginibacter sp. X4EP1]|uniref:glycosyltransferase family 4 protein n=1 Tax=Mucilaginibacter sp. X4EP1 TaxID=2723092 RepID=UPI002169D1B6|nr:glycosyltransferase family 4 protein [Mucilaginibacter sp. X4EP1]MCS3814077.1 glycosyltransferase involved in cell wall biosynthesis [Mucilaginibacter sp. X4EP1]